MDFSIVYVQLFLHCFVFVFVSFSFFFPSSCSFSLSFYAQDLHQPVCYVRTKGLRRVFGTRFELQLTFASKREGRACSKKAREDA